MATRNAIEAAVHLVYGSHGKTPTNAMVDAYEVALQSRSDNQVDLAAMEAVARGGQWPASAAELLRMSGNYPREKTETREPERAPMVRWPSMSEHRRAMREECLDIIENGTQGEADFCRLVLKKLEENEGNPFAAIAPTIAKA